MIVEPIQETVKQEGDHTRDFMMALATGNMPLPEEATDGDQIRALQTAVRLYQNRIGELREAKKGQPVMRNIAPTKSGVVDPWSEAAANEKWRKLNEAKAKLADKGVSDAAGQWVKEVSSGVATSSAPPTAAVAEQSALLAASPSAPPPAKSVVKSEPAPSAPLPAKSAVKSEPHTSDAKAAPDAPVAEDGTEPPITTPKKIDQDHPQVRHLQSLASLGVKIDRTKFADGSYYLRHDLIAAAYMAMYDNTKESPVPVFGEPSAWLNEPMYRDYHRSCIKYINTGFRKYDFKIQVDFADEPAVDIMINRKRFGSNKFNQMQKIKVAYHALASVTSGPVAMFGEPNNWLNCDMYEKLHLEAISELQKQGMAFAE